MNNSNENNDWAKRDIGALWKREGKNQKYLSGYFKLENGQEVKVVIFSNKNKQNNEKAPDYRVYVSKPTDSNSSATKTTANTNVNNNFKKNIKKPEVTKDILEEDLL